MRSAARAEGVLPHGIVLENGRARIESRRGLDWSSALAKLTAGAAQLPARELVLDGEACAFAAGRPRQLSGHAEAFRRRRSGRGALAYFAFDLLHLDGEGLARLRAAFMTEYFEALPPLLKAHAPRRPERGLRPPARAW
jgi:bifunctional non-homologous end joining protein LigD